MKQVILDTSFILTCVKQKIDFLEELKFMGLKILVPKQVLGELSGIASSKKEAELALHILGKKGYNSVDIKSKNVDEGLIKYAGKDRNVFVATLDKEIKKKLTNSVVVIREKKRLEII